MAVRKPFASAASHSKSDESANKPLSKALQEFEGSRHGCDTLTSQPKLLDRFFNDPAMNDLDMLVRFFTFLLKSVAHARPTASRLVLRLPGSELLRFAYNHLRPSAHMDERQTSTWQKLIHNTSKLLQQLLELHPSCWDQLNAMGIFDRLELYSGKTSDEDIQLNVAELVSRVSELRVQHTQKTRPVKEKDDGPQDQVEPPPDDFHQLSIYPTLDEIFEQQMPYLRKNITAGQYTNGTHYLDIHFRLLREDFLQPLREAVCQYISDDYGNLSYRNANVRLYRNVVLTGTTCSHAGVLISLSIDKSILSKSISWANSRRLMYGNLLAATFDDFASSFFLVTIEDRSNIDKNGTILVRCQKELCNYTLMRILPGTVFTLLETTSYFEAYRPILQALQNIKDDQLPLEKYLLHCDTDVALPSYFEQKSEIDFQPILVKNSGACGDFDGGLSNVKDLATWPNAQQLGLDASQYRALQLAMTKAVALIQGPPGCGKTFLGVRLAELFYHNRHRIGGCERPILMICYTNHALDQFLSSIIRKLSLEPGQIVRVGGRSTHADIEPFLIQKLRHQRRDARSKSKELSEKYEILGNIKAQLDECQKLFQNCSRQVLNATQLLRVMDKSQFLTLIEPILTELEIHNDHWCSSAGGIYCCRSTKQQASDDSDASDADSTSTTEDNDEEPFRDLSVTERQQRMKNRVDCHRLEKLHANDQEKISQLFIQWLGAQQVDFSTYKNRAEVEDDGEGEFEVKRKRKHRNQYKAEAVLKEILSDPLVSATRNTTATTTVAAATSADSVDENQNGDNEDEEEQRRMENVDYSYIPFALSNRRNEKDEERPNVEYLAYLCRLRSSKTELLSDEQASSTTDLWSPSLTKECRQALYRYWLCKYIQHLVDEWYRLNEQYDENHQLMQELWLANDQLYMDDAFIIAMTTHCASRYQKVLKQIAPRICIVEEAAEVFESHIVTAIGERIEHLILIGDHIQLRPSPNVYTLAKHFKLDVSLFERLINNKMPSVQLSEQHRSIPIISELTHHFYDLAITHHASVLDRPTITGVNHPLYFITHSQPEENVSDGVSKRNAHECHYVIQLANYLVNQGYDKSQITILTTYMGQRQLIQRTITQFSKHLKGIQVTVVDNFQGEENRIILLSLVRSNPQGRLGYLGVDNRICVALSRAQDGFYVIGNFHLLVKNSDTWKVVVEKIKQSKLIGEGLPIGCANHPDNQTICVHPNDFLKRPLGGCGLKCESRLACGHQCPLSCHSTSHSQMVCEKICQKSYDDCAHQCQKQCHPGTDCPLCYDMISLKMPNCEHTSSIPCFMLKTNQLECGVLVSYTCPLGHQVTVRCCDLRDRKLRDRLCNQPCGFILECGHVCKGTCSVCLQGRFHRSCDEQELVVYACGHGKQQRCHELGPRCEEPFIKVCGHQDQPKAPADANCCDVYKCHRFCLDRCRQRRCTQRCYLQCDCLPCEEKCSRRFDCEHYCNGVCGEPCIDCLKCRENDLPKNIRAAIQGRNLRSAIFVELECGHLFGKNELDTHVNKFTEKHFLANGFMRVDYPRCPLCQHSMVRCKRYMSLMKKIHSQLMEMQMMIHTSPLASVQQSVNRLLAVISDVPFPKAVVEVVEKNMMLKRRLLLTELFVHVVKLYQTLTARIETERNEILTAVYEYTVKNGTLLFTRQQWLDLEKEYNRLLLIDRFRMEKERLGGDFDAAKLSALNDILFGLNPFSQFAWEIALTLLTPADGTDSSWKSILPTGKKWADFDKERLVCDGKLFVCPQKPTGHFVWMENDTEPPTCPTCKSADDARTTNSTGVRRPEFRGGFTRTNRYAPFLPRAPDTTN